MTSRAPAQSAPETSCTDETKSMHAPKTYKGQTIKRKKKISPQVQNKVIIFEFLTQIIRVSHAEVIHLGI